jgi:hypothetical protein
MKVGQSKKMPLSRCPGCGKALDGASGIGGDFEPEPGDFTVCITCGHLAVFDQRLMLRNLTEIEIHEIAADRRVLAVQAARAAIAKDKPK